MHYLGRQPILDTRQQIHGYEFFARSNGAEDAQINDALLSSASVLVSIFSSLGLEEALGGKLGFVNFSNDLLDDETLALFPKERLILEIQPSPGCGAEYIEHCKKIRAMGFTLALDNFRPDPVSISLLPLASYIKLNMLETSPEQLKSLMQAFRKLPLKTVATRVETPETAELCVQGGIHYLQGFYFSRPAMLEDRNPNSSKVSIIQILNQLMGGAEIDLLEEGISRDTALSYKLLRYINSAGMGQSYEISSIRRALVALGRQQLYRWLTLILFAGTSDAPPSALVGLAATRGRLAELIGQHSPTPALHEREAQDQLFIVGMFSLLEALLNMPLSRILTEIKLPEAIVAALTTRSGPYGDILLLIEALEKSDIRAINTYLSNVGIDGDALSKLYLEAMAWSANL